MRKTYSGVEAPESESPSLRELKMELKSLHPEAVEASLEKAKHYRLLNDPENAESICLSAMLPVCKLLHFRLPLQNDLGNFSLT